MAMDQKCVQLLEKKVRSKTVLKDAQKILFYNFFFFFLRGEKFHKEYYENFHIVVDG